MAKKLKEPVYAVMPHPSDKIFKYVKSKYEPIDKKSDSYKLFMDNYKKYRNSKEVKKLNQSLKENINIKKSIKMELMNKQDFLKSLNKTVNESENNKTFICEWNLEVYPEAESLTCTPGDFTDENGYSEEDITSILSLEPGCKYELDGGNQVVTCCPLVPLETEPVLPAAEPIASEPTEMATSSEPLSMEDFEDEDDDSEEEEEEDDDQSYGDEFEDEDQDLDFEDEESEMNEYLSKETVPVFKGLSAYNKPIEFIEPNKTPSKIESILSSGKDVVIAAKIAKQHPDVPEHKKESEFNVTSVVGNTVNVVSAKYNHEYEITDPRKIEELYIVEKKPEEAAVNEAKNNKDVSEMEPKDLVKALIKKNARFKWLKTDLPAEPTLKELKDILNKYGYGKELDELTKK